VLPDLTLDFVGCENCPYQNPADPKHISADQSVREFEQAGVRAAKLVLGVPFYGHVWDEVPDQNHGLFQLGKPMPNAYAPYNDISGRLLNDGWDPEASAYRSNYCPISSSKRNQQRLPIVASASIRGHWIRSGWACSTGRSSEVSCSGCVPRCVFRVTLISPRSAGALIMIRSSTASAHTGRVGSICFGMNTFSTLRKAVVVETPQLGHATYVLAKPRCMDRTTSGETATMPPSVSAFWGA
jgi:hypothetical protein